MQSHWRANLWLLGFTMVICSVLYPAILLGIGQTVLPDQAQGSLVTDAQGKIRGSRLIAQPFTGDEYFWPRPSAVSYDAKASGASNWGASNYKLRDRVARQLGPIVRYGNGAEKMGKTPGQLVGQDIDTWFQKDTFKDKDGKTQTGIVARWADLHAGLAEAWILDAGGKLKEQWGKVDKDSDKVESFLAQWQEDYPDLYADWKKKNPDQAAPPAADVGAAFFASFSKAYPGYWPYVDDVEAKDKSKRKKITRVKEASDSQTEIRSVFFDMWRNEHPDVPLEEVPADMVMTSGSGLDPHITLANAMYQLKYRVAAAQAQKLIKGRGADAASAQKEIEGNVRGILEALLQEHKEAPLGGLVGVDLVNVLELNLAMDRRMEKLARE